MSDWNDENSSWHGWNKGKSPHKFKYTYQDIADITGLSLHTIWKYAQLGKFDPHSLESVARFIIKRL